MLPVIDLSKLAFLAFKFSVFMVGIVLFISYIDGYIFILRSAWEKVFIPFSNISNIDFGVFLSRIGLVSFLNSIIDTLVVASGFFFVSLGSILLSKFSMRLFKFFMSL